MAVATLDMSAAFDVVDHVLLMKRLKKMGMPKNLLTVIGDWLSDRFFYCEINGMVSKFTKIEAGTVQGSILGPMLYSLFTSQIADMVKYLVTFADDNYQLGTASTEAGAIEDCVSRLNIVVSFLRDSGLHINNSKTEICVFHGRDTRINTAIINGQEVLVSKVMRILGVYFDSKLTWFNHVSHAINSANKAKQALCIINRFFSLEELLKLSTAYFYSRLYYGARVWLHSGLNGLLKKKLWQASSRMLQVVDKDYRRLKSFNELHKLYKRASPHMWSNYTTAISMYNVVHMSHDYYFMPLLILNNLHNERRKGVLFTRCNRTKMGFNCLSNRLQVVSNRLKIDWMSMTPSSFKLLCKRMFILEPLDRL